MDTSRLLTIEQARQMLARVGVELPRDTPPDAVFRGLDVLLQGVPDRAVAAAAIPGAEVRFGAQAGITLPPFSPVNYSHNLAIQGRVSLSGVETGPGLQQSQTFRASVQLQQDDRAALERTLINRLYRYTGQDYTDLLPRSARDALQGPIQAARDRVESNPLARAFVRGVPVGIVHTESAGTRLSYEAVVPPELGRRLDAGDTSALPNPLDPMRMAPGSGVLVRGQDFATASTDLRYKLAMTGDSRTELEGRGFGVRRLEGSMVEVYAGPMSAVEQSVYVGLGRNSFNVRLEAENTLEHRRLSVARMDLSTPQGQEAYRRFMENGQVPEVSGPGIPQAGTSEQVSIEQARRLGFTVGNASLSFDASSNQQVTLNRTNGREELQFSYARGNLATESTYPMRDGRVDLDAGRYRIVLQDLDASQAQMLRGTFGGEPGGRALDASQNVQITMDAQQMLALRDRSREFVASRPGMAASVTDPLARIARANTAQEVFAAFQDRPQDIPSALHRLNAGVEPEQRRPVPGGLEIQPPERMRAWLAGRPEAERGEIMERYYRAGDARQPSPATRTGDEPAPAARDAQPTAAGRDTATAPGLPLTHRDHPDHALFTALRARLPERATDDQVALATERARGVGITADSLTQVGASTRNPDEIWMGTGIQGQRASIDLSQPAPPMQQIADQLSAQAQATHEKQQAEERERQQSQQRVQAVH